MYSLKKEVSEFTHIINSFKSDLEMMRNFKENSILSFKDLSNEIYKK